MEQLIRAPRKGTITSHFHNGPRKLYTVTTHCLPETSTITTYTIPTLRSPSIATIDDRATPPPLPLIPSIPTLDTQYTDPDAVSASLDERLPNPAEDNNKLNETASLEQRRSSFFGSIRAAVRGNKPPAKPNETHSKEENSDDELHIKHSDVDFGRNEYTSEQTTAANITSIESAASSTTTTTTANSYSRNKSTTRSWPVIHRNNSYYRYQTSSGSGGGGGGGGGGGFQSTANRRQPTSHQQHGYLQYDYDAPLLQQHGVNYCPPNDTNNNTLLGYGTANASGNDYHLLASGHHYPSGAPPDKSPSIDSCYYYQHYSTNMQPSATTTTIMATTTTSSSGPGGVATTTTTTSGNTNHQQTPTGNGTCCSIPPPIMFLFLTLLMTSSATAMLCAAIMTDHWEHVSWDRTSLDRISNESAIELHWYLDGRAAKIPLKGKGLPTQHHQHHHHHQSGQKGAAAPVVTDNRAGVFLVPMNGGIWTLCIDLTPDEIRTMSNDGFPQVDQCVNYLAGTMESAQGNDEDARADWQHSESQASLHPHLRMQNLSISCSLVCLIILGSAALVGAFGVCQRQISAVLVTGVMYLLAALFALFTLMIIHFKRQQGRPLLDSDFDGTIDGVVAIKGTARAASKFLGARIFVTAWSLDLGWGGVVLCAFTSFLWILLSKIMRFNPLSAMI
uniref:Uncharacterized protein n=1 Tax=Anopheles minimus TaxID=112268 RepID=A0A182VRU9_9DIPT